MVDRIIDAIRSPNKSLMASRLEGLRVISDGEERRASPPLLAAAMWTLVHRRLFADVTVAAEWLGDHWLMVHNDRALHAALRAYGCLGKPLQAKQLVGRTSDPALAPSTASLALQAFCLADRLDLVEQLLHDWLQRHMLQQSILTGAAHGVDQKVDSLLRSLCLQTAAETEQPQTSTLLLLPAGSEEHIGATLPSLATWEELVRFYSTRRAWRPCLAVLAFMESLGPAKFVSCRADPSEESVQFLEATEVMYHHTIRALSSCRVTHQAFDVLRRMRASGKDPGVAIWGHMFKAVVEDLPHHAKADFELLVDHVLMFLVRMGDQRRDDSDRGAYSHFGLVSALISALCKRGYLSEAERALEILKEHKVAFGKEPIFTLIHAFSIDGQWQKAVRLYEDIGVRISGKHGSDAHMAPPPNSQKVFHHVCGGLRRAGQLEELARFILLHSPENKVPNA